MDRFFRAAMLVTIVALLGPPIPSVSGPLPEASQTKLYNNTKEIPCPQPDEPLYGQNANDLIGWRLASLSDKNTLHGRNNTGSPFEPDSPALQPDCSGKKSWKGDVFIVRRGYKRMNSSPYTNGAINELGE